MGRSTTTVGIPTTGSLAVSVFEKRFEKVSRSCGANPSEDESRLLRCLRLPPVLGQRIGHVSKPDRSGDRLESLRSLHDDDNDGGFASISFGTTTQSRDWILCIRYQDPWITVSVLRGGWDTPVCRCGIIMQSNVTILSNEHKQLNWIEISQII
ncbi:hypothetical protein VTN31DRAFT_7166 [Thermomyces dupontii]|uniref:uncharacterized protein n=1 Tax=Talaromyces thermophilus TaxID=28565 RepID=UPI003744282D